MAAEPQSNRITAAVIFEPIWMPKTTPDPRADVATLRKQAEHARSLEEEAVRAIKGLGYGIYGLVEELNAEFGATSPTIRDTSDGKATWHPHRCWFGAHEAIAIALGAPEPRWDGRTESWWMDRDRHALDWVKSVSDVRRIPVPEWEREPMVGRMLESRQRWEEAFPDSPPGRWAGSCLNLPGREPVRCAGYAWFVDLGVYLFGATEFMTLLAGDTQLAEALMEKCFELSTTYSDFLQSLEGGKFCGLGGFGGDCACMLSPRLYEKYSAAWDVWLFEHFQKLYATPDDTPCILHSCGPSAHLYPEWGRHPLSGNIAKVETRMLPEHVKELRRNLPDALLELMFHPQHYDFACVEPEEVRATLRQALEDVEYRDVRFIVLAFAHEPKHVERLEINLQAFYEGLSEVNN